MQQRSFIIHLATQEEQNGLGVDQDRNTIFLNHFVERLRCHGVIHDIFHAGTAAILHGRGLLAIGYR